MLKRGDIQMSADGDSRVLPYEHDPEADASYIYLSPGSGPIVRQVAMENAPGRFDLILDLTEDGKVVGIEIIGSSAFFVDARTPGRPATTGD